MANTFLNRIEDQASSHGIKIYSIAAASDIQNKMSTSYIVR